MVAFLVPLIIQCVLPIIGNILCDASPIFLVCLASIPFSPVCWMILFMTYTFSKILNIKITYGKDEKGQPQEHYFLTAYIAYFIIMLVIYISIKGIICSGLGAIS